MMHHNEPLVSVIIPTYNRHALLRQTLSTVLAQTYPHLEIIVVDDGSTDDTARFLADLQGHITVLCQPNQGVIATRNQGFRVAKGAYITFLDDDDLLAPDKIARQVAYLEQHREVGLVHCSYHKCDSAGQLVETVWLSPTVDNWLQLACGNFIWSGGPLIRREYVEQVGGYDETTQGAILSCEDWDLWLRLARAGCRFGVIQRPLGTYRILPHSLVTHFEQLERAVLTVLQRTFAVPNLPAHHAAAEPLAYAHMHLWLSARGYAEGATDAGRHHLQAALHAHPDWCTQPETVLSLLRGHALDARVIAPPQFVTDLFEHLPDEAEFLRPHYPWLLAYAHLGLALRQLAAGRVMAAKAGFAAAIYSYPALAQQPEQVSHFIAHHALHLPVTEPIWFAGAALAQLPFSIRATRGDVALGWAFQAYAAGELGDVPRRVLRAWWYRPLLLRNRGAWAILLKALRRDQGVT